MEKDVPVCSSEVAASVRQEAGGELSALVAGAGLLPVLIARKFSDSGRDLVVYSLVPNPELASLHGVEVVSPGTANVSTGRGGSPLFLDIRATLDDMLRRGVTSVTMAGVVPKSAMYSASLDSVLGSLLKRGSNDDHGLLGRIVAVFEGAGLSVVPYASILAEGLAPEGFVAGREPTEQEAADAEYGKRILSVTLPLSFGQSVVVAGGAVLAVEAMEGTDLMILRGGSILSAAKKRFAGAASGEGNSLAVAGGTVVKMMRPDQDHRYDVPAVGVSTLETMRSAGLTCLAVEAGRTLVIEPRKFAEQAASMDIAVCGISAGSEPLDGPVEGM